METNYRPSPVGESSLPTISTNTRMTFEQVDKLEAEGAKLESIAVQSEGLHHCQSARSLNNPVGESFSLTQGVNSGILNSSVRQAERDEDIPQSGTEFRHSWPPQTTSGGQSQSEPLECGRTNARDGNAEVVCPPQSSINEPTGRSDITSYIRYSSGLDESRSISSLGVNTGIPHSAEYLSHINNDSQIGCRSTNYDRVPNGNEFQAAASSGRFLPNNAQHCNITSNTSVEDNLCGEGDSVPLAEKSLNNLMKPGFAGGSCVDVQSLEQAGSSSGEPTMMLCSDSEYVVHLPAALVRYLAGELDVSGDEGGVGWGALAELKGFTFSQVRRIEGNRRILSPFKHLLSLQAFSEYTVGQLKKDLYKLPRRDILRHLANDTWMNQ